MTLAEWVWEQVKDDWDSLTPEEQLNTVTALVETYNEETNSEYQVIEE